MESSDLESSEFLFSYIEFCEFRDRQYFFIFCACLALYISLLFQCILIGIEKFGDLFLGLAC